MRLDNGESGGMILIYEPKWNINQRRDYFSWRNKRLLFFRGLAWWEQHARIRHNKCYRLSVHVRVYYTEIVCRIMLSDNDWFYRDLGKITNLQGNIFFIKLWCLCMYGGICGISWVWSVCRSNLDYFTVSLHNPNDRQLYAVIAVQGTLSGAQCIVSRRMH